MLFIRRIAKGLCRLARSSEIGGDRGSLAALPAPAQLPTMSLAFATPPSPGGTGCMCNRVTTKKKQ